MEKVIDTYELIDALTDRQRDVLGNIAMGFDTGHHPRTVAALIRKGLIEEYTETLPGRFPVTVKRYSVPMSVHVFWCQWCSDHVTEKDLEAMEQDYRDEVRANLCKD